MLLDISEILKNAENCWQFFFLGGAYIEQRYPSPAHR